MNMIPRLALIAIALCGTSPALELSSVFTDHMVLQQEMNIPVWGKADPGESVTVTFAGKQATAKAGPDGKWLVKLAPLKASAIPQTLKAKGSSGEKSIHDVLIGEVWIASGQSNMALPLANSKGTAEDKAADPLIRLLHLTLNPQAKPVDQIGKSWQADEKENLGGFSAVAYYFARHLTATRKVPVGIINSSVGGTPARAWTPWESMANDPQLKHQTDRIEAEMKKYDPDVAERKYREALAAYEAALAKQPAGKQPKKPTPPVPPTCYQHSPSALYNGMIAPLAPMAIRGAIWYQGEADAKASAEYRILLPELIQSWRKAFGHEIPFLFVQIAPHEQMVPEIRDAQLHVWRTVPMTAMAVITDYGDATNIHPKDKKPVGDRLGLAARAIAYGENITYSGPLFDQMKVEGDKAVLSFRHLGSGLMAKDGALKGFEISSDGTRFVPANAEIRGEQIVLSNTTVKSPMAVRFGWANVPDTNLFNKEGLPATPFQASIR